MQIQVVVNDVSMVIGGGGLILNLRVRGEFNGLQMVLLIN